MLAAYHFEYTIGRVVVLWIMKKRKPQLQAYKSQQITHRREIERGTERERERKSQQNREHTPPNSENANNSLLMRRIAGCLLLRISLHASRPNELFVEQSISMPLNKRSIARPVQNASVGLWKSSRIAATATCINWRYSKCTVRPTAAITARRDERGANR